MSVMSSQEKRSAEELADTTQSGPQPRRIQRYVLQERLGEGGEGAVYRAWDPVLQREVALKVLLPDNVEPKQITRFINEASLASSLNHPNIISIYDVGMQYDVPYMVMEFLEGSDLQTLIFRSGPLSIERTADLVLPIVAAISAAHAQGVLHRDLKPGNVLIAQDRFGRELPKVLDFGIAKFDTGLLTEPTRPQILGTPAYLPPEGVHGEHRLVKESDCFGLGTILYECVTGRPPYGQRRLLEQLRAVEVADFEKPSGLIQDLDEEFERLILWAMHPSAAARPTADELGRALLQFAGEQALARYRDEF